MKTFDQSAIHVAVNNSKNADNALAGLKNTFKLCVNGYMTSFTMKEM